MYGFSILVALLSCFVQCNPLFFFIIFSDYSYLIFEEHFRLPDTSCATHSSCAQKLTCRKLPWNPVSLYFLGRPKLYHLYFLNKRTAGFTCRSLHRFQRCNFLFLLFYEYLKKYHSEVPHVHCFLSWGSQLARFLRIGTKKKFYKRHIWETVF